MRDAFISIRVSETERLRFELAAGVRGESRSAFLRKAARREADRELGDLRGRGRERNGNAER